MKISEILIEAGEFEKGQNFAKRLLSPSQWIKSKSGGDYERGSEFGQKLLSPSEWFKSNPNASSDDDEEKTTKKKIKTANTVSPTPPSSEVIDQTKQILRGVLRGEPRYNDDIKQLSAFRASVKSGKIQTNVNSDQLSSALKTIINGDQLSNDQTKLINQFIS